MIRSFFKAKRKLLIVSLLVSILSGGILVADLPKTPLNLIIISADALRPDHMGIYGYSKDTTPNIDKLAGKSAVFTSLRTIVPMTYPSFAAFMTGKNPINSRIFANRQAPISENSKTLASLLQENGYATGVFTTGALNPRVTNINQGADQDAYEFIKNYRYENGVEKYYQAPQSTNEAFVQKSLDWLNDNKGKKFFYWIHLMDPHAPYQPPDKYKCKFNPKYCGYILSKNYSELENERADLQFCKNVPVPQDTLEIFETLYDGGVGYTDELAGKILDKIKDLGLDKNSIIVFYSDHGEGFDHNYYFNHRGVLYESALKIPLIIKTPSMDQSIKINNQILNTDILPTLLDLLGIKKEDKILDGRSFSKFVNNSFAKYIPDRDQELNFFYNSTLTKFAVVEGRYKYIYSTKSACLLDDQLEELYDLSADPQELKNIINQNPKVHGKLKQALLGHLSKYNLPSQRALNPERFKKATDSAVEGSDTLRQLPY